MNKFLFMIFIVLTGCGASEMNNKNSKIELALGNSIDEVMTSTTLKLSKDCGSTFCNYDFDTSSTSKNLISVGIKSNGYTLEINDVHSITLVTTLTGTITDMDVYAVGVPSDAQHEEAMKYFYQQVHNLNTAGWRRYIFPDEARLAGSEASKFTDFNEVLGKHVGTGPWMDPNLRLTKQIWVSMPMYDPWRFYNGNEYLNLTVDRENSEDDPQNRASYLFTWTFKSENEFYAQFVKGEDRKHWRELLPAELARMAKEREKTEAQLKKMGIQIDENYKDAKPPVKAG